MSSGDVTAVFDVGAIVGVVGVAIVFLVRRFTGKGASNAAAPVVVGDALQRGLQRAQQKRKKRRG